MTTAVTSPAGRGARASDTGRGLLGFRSRRRRRATTAVAAALALVAGCLLVASDLHARTEIRTTDVSLASADRQLSGLRSELARVRQRLAGARARDAVVTRSFDAAQSTLSATQKTLAHDEAGIHAEGVDVGVLDSCLSGVEQALNQIAVGQTAGGLASLRASSLSCSALNGAV
jgi:septal ring factor EnvC (AmiA/AmiB activator)